MKVTPINTGILIEVANGNTVLNPLQAFHVMKNLEHAIMDYCKIHDVHIDENSIRKGRLHNATTTNAWAYTSSYPYLQSVGKFTASMQ